MPGDRFVEDGWQRAMQAIDVGRIKAEIRRAVEAEYASRGEDAGPLRRMLLRLRMSREIGRRVHSAIEKTAPGGGLYCKQQG